MNTAPELSPDWLEVGVPCLIFERLNATQGWAQMSDDPTCGFSNKMMTGYHILRASDTKNKLHAAPVNVGKVIPTGLLLTCSELGQPSAGLLNVVYIKEYKIFLTLNCSYLSFCSVGHLNDSAALCLLIVCVGPDIYSKNVRSEVQNHLMQI